MGNRALVVFHNADKSEYSPVIYLHGHEAAPLIQATATLMANRRNDVGYAAARFIGIAAQHIGGNLSLGTWNLVGAPPATGEPARRYWCEMSHGNQGVFVVNADTFKVKRYQ